MFYLWLAALFLAVGVLNLLARRNPQAKWVRVLWSQHGPRLDAGRMTRAECLGAAGGFGVIAAMAVGTIWLIDIVALKLGLNTVSNLSVQVVFFTYTIILMMAIGGGIYMLIRAPFRPRAIEADLGPDGDDA